MEKATVIFIRDKFKEAGIEQFTVEFNNNYSIHVGYDSHAVMWDDANGVLWEVGPKTNTIVHNVKNIGEWRAFCYDEIQFFRAGVNFKEANVVANTSGCEVTEEVTNVIKKLGSSSGIYPVQEYPDKDKDGNPVIYGSMPSCRSGL